MSGTPAVKSGSQKADEMRITYGHSSIIAGFVLVGVAFAVAVFRWEDPEGVALVVGVVTSLVGTVVGAFFGVQVGAQGKEKAEAARDQAETKASEALAALPPGEAGKVLDRVR